MTPKAFPAQAKAMVSYFGENQDTFRVYTSKKTSSAPSLGIVISKSEVITGMFKNLNRVGAIPGWTLKSTEDRVSRVFAKTPIPIARRFMVLQVVLSINVHGIILRDKWLTPPRFLKPYLFFFPAQTAFATPTPASPTIASYNQQLAAVFNRQAEGQAEMLAIWNDGRSRQSYHRPRPTPLESAFTSATGAQDAQTALVSRG
ncbi:unnamed protein product [Rhizopus stolonifer]